MKNYLFFLPFMAILFTSCGNMYKFVQVVETTPSDYSTKQTKSGELHEDDNCAVFHRFWAEGGDASFAFYNKTDEVVYIDLSKSFFIRNGIAQDYYKEREWTETKSRTQTVQSSASKAVTANVSYGVSANYLGIFGHEPLSQFDPISTSASYSESYGVLYATSQSNAFATSRSSSESVKEQRYLAIPPHSYKIVAEYNIGNNLIVDCDLTRYPSDKASIVFSEENSPLHFENYITYRIGNSEKDNVVENKFYVSKITNYANPAIFEFVERKTKPCQNVTEDTSKKYKDTYSVKVYDKVVNAETTHSYYNTYKIFSDNHLYKKGGQNFYYSEQYDGYIRESSTTTSSGFLRNTK